VQRRDRGADVLVLDERGAPALTQPLGASDDRRERRALWRRRDPGEQLDRCAFGSAT